MACYIRYREVRVIDGKEWFHDEEEYLFPNPFYCVAKLFYDYTDDCGENGTIELSREVWDRYDATVEEEFPNCLDEIEMIREYWRVNPLSDRLVCNVR